MLTLYKTLMSCAAPALSAYLKARTARGKEDPLRAHERLGNPCRPRPSGVLVWCHAASVGEALSLLSLIHLILQKRPDVRVMVTTGTVTSAKLMADRLPEGAFHQYLPVDHPRWVARFLDHWKPDLVLWTESEFWPNMLSDIKTRHIPAMLLNARMSPASFQKWQWVKGSARALLSTFKTCFAQNDAEAARLKTLGAANVKISGNLKYAAAPLPVDEATLSSIRAGVSARPLLLWASTHAGEEDIACRLHRALAKTFPTLLTVIVPRHPKRGDEIAEIIQDEGFALARRGKGEMPEARHDIYLADTLGELGLFYRLCPVTVMGGSFAKIGGHNPIEPAQIGSAIILGPEMFNFLSVRADFEGAQAAISVLTEEGLQKETLFLLQHPEETKAMAMRAKALVERQAGVTDDIWREIEILLPLKKETAA